MIRYASLLTKIMNYIFTLMVAVFLSGCAPIWVQTNGQFQGTGYTLDLPKGWMTSTNPKNLVITTDGPELQSIFLSVIDLVELEKKQDKGKPYNKRVKKGMLPQEAAETILDNMRSDKSIAQFTLIENIPAQVGGKDGFKLDYTYKLGKLREKCIYYGMLNGDNFYRISYCAPVRYYFDKDVAQFEKIAASFRIE